MGSIAQQITISSFKKRQNTLLFLIFIFSFVKQ